MKNQKWSFVTWGNIELFELCEAIPKVQCSECLLNWNEGIVFCTCGHLFKESEAGQHFQQWRLDAFSIENYVIKQERPRGARHGRTEVQKEHFIAHNARRRCLEKKFEGIHDRFLRLWFGQSDPLFVPTSVMKTPTLSTDDLSQEDPLQTYREPSGQAVTTKSCD